MVNAATISTSHVDSFIEQIPTPDEIRDRLGENLRQKRLLKEMLKLAEKRQGVRNVSGTKGASRA